MNLNHREIERLEGLVKALKKHIELTQKLHDTGYTKYYGGELHKVEKEIEFYSNPKNF